MSFRRSLRLRLLVTGLAGVAVAVLLSTAYSSARSMWCGGRPVTIRGWSPRFARTKG